MVDDAVFRKLKQRDSKIPRGMRYEQWLDHFDIVRPHRTGRWRVRWRDVQTGDMLPGGGPIWAGCYCAFAPTKLGLEYFHRWAASDERRVRANAAGFLRVARKHRHVVDGDGRKLVSRVQAMCHAIRDAMHRFSVGDAVSGQARMRDAWDEYMLIQTIGHSKATVEGYRAMRSAADRVDKSAATKNANRKALDDLYIETYDELIRAEKSSGKDNLAKYAHSKAMAADWSALERKRINASSAGRWLDRKKAN